MNDHHASISGDHGVRAAGSNSSVEPGAPATVSGGEELKRDARGGDVRVSTLIGDRACISCGYNLVGQPILREPHYQLLIVRCPECGTTASTQEYPLLGRWAGRWAAVLSAVWFLLLIGLLAGTAGAQLGFAIGAAEMASSPMSEALWNEYNTYRAMPGSPTVAIGPTGPTAPPAAAMPVSFQSWWMALSDGERNALLVRTGWQGVQSPALVAFMVPTALVSLIFGVVWAVVIIGRRRGGLIAFSLVPLLALALMASFPITMLLSDAANAPGDIAFARMGVGVMLAVMVLEYVVLMAGLMVGRPVVRSLLKVLLVPRLLVPLSILWQADGLEVPRMKSRSVATSVRRP